MNTEFEAKFVQVNLDEFRSKLESLGAVMNHPMRPMRRAIIKNQELNNSNAFLRVRDEGDKITLTYKRFDSLSIDGAKEHEVTVGDFNETISLLAAAGLPYKSIQESKRETWKLNNTEIVLDEWPWLDPYIEIEGEDEESVKITAKLLGFDWQDAVFGDIMAAYRAQYPSLSHTDTLDEIPKVCFGDPLPPILKNN